MSKIIVLVGSVRKNGNTELLADADMIVIASPVYFYGISAQLKAMVDRFHTPLWK